MAELGEASGKFFFFWGGARRVFYRTLRGDGQSVRALPCGARQPGGHPLDPPTPLASPHCASKSHTTPCTRPHFLVGLAAGGAGLLRVNSADGGVGARRVVVAGRIGLRVRGVEYEKHKAVWARVITQRRGRGGA